MAFRNQWLQRHLRSLIETPERPYSRRLGHYYRPWLEGLEDRSLPSTLELAANPGVLDFTGGAASHNLTISLSGGTYTFADPTETIALGPTALGAGWLPIVPANTVTGPQSSVTTIIVDLSASSGNTVTIDSIGNAITSLNGGGGANNTLVGPLSMPTAWNFTGANSGDFTGAGASVAFSNTQNITTGTGNDTFTFSGSGSISGTIDGGGGNDTITGSDINHIWNITGTNAGNVAGMVSNFLNIENVTGGAANDDFVFADAASLAGMVNGGVGGTDSLDYSLYTTSVAIDLTTGTATGTGGVANILQVTGGQANDTITGNPSGTTVIFASPGIDTVDGGGSLATLVGANATNSWVITAADGGTLTSGANTTTFMHVQSLTGGTGADTFTFTATGSISGTIDGGGGNNTLQGNNANHTWTITGPNAGSVPGMAAAFVNIPNLTGGTGADTFTFMAAGSISGTIDGGGGNNTLQGNNASHTWTITAPNAGSVNVIVNAFVNIQNLSGGTANDDFIFSGTGSISGTIDGGGSPGSDQFDLSALGTLFAATLTGPGTTHGFQGTAGAFVAMFDNIDTIIGTTNAGNSLTGPNALTMWTITGVNAGAAVSSGRTLSFSNIPNLTGGTGADTFTFMAAGSISGTIDGGGGNNTLQGNNASHTWTITAPNAGSVNVIVNAFVNIQNLSGGTANDNFIFSGTGSISGTIDGGGGNNILQGNNANNSWNITGSNAGNVSGMVAAFVNIPNLTGGTGADTFTFTTAGSISGTIDGGGGNNIIQGNNANNTWNISGSNAGNVPGMVAAFVNIPNLTGGTGADTFTFTAAGSISSTIDGGGVPAGQKDTLNWISYATSRGIALTTLGSLHGYAGTEASIGGGFQNIDQIIGSGTASGNFLTGAPRNTTWIIAGIAAGMLQDSAVGNTLMFADIQTVNGGGGAANSLIGPNINNTWNLIGSNSGNIAGVIAFSGMQNLIGGNQADSFVFSNGALITGKIDGGPAGTDTLDWSAYTSPRIVNVTGLGSVHGFAGTETGSPPSLPNFDNIDVVIGAGAGPGGSTLMGPNADNVWNITGTNSGTLVTQGRTLPFSGFANLHGGSQMDAFMFGASGSLTGTIDGGGIVANKVDSIDWSADPTARTITLTGASSHGLGGADSSAAPSLVSFTNIDKLTGSNAGGNRLFGPNAANIWNITGADVGTIASGNSLAFMNFQNLTGGSQGDDFIFNPAGSLSGALNGGGTGAGQFDVIDFSALTTDRNATLTGPSPVHGFAGTEALIGGGFLNIDRIIATSSTFANTLTGDNNAGTWLVGAANGNVSGVYTDNGHALNLVNFQVLKGGSGANTFNVISTPAGFTITITGFTGPRAFGSNDVFNLGTDGTASGTKTLDGLVGPLTINAGSHDGEAMPILCAGSPYALTPVGNALYIDDQGNAKPATYNLTDTTFSHDRAFVTFSGMKFIQLNGGSNNDTFNVTLSVDHTIQVIGGSGTNSLTFPNLPAGTKLTSMLVIPAPPLTTVCYQNIQNLTQANSLAVSATLETDSQGNQKVLLRASNSLFNVNNANFDIPRPAVIAAPTFSNPFGFTPPSVAVGRVQGSPLPDVIVGLGGGFAPLVTVVDGTTFFEKNGQINVIAQFYAYNSAFFGGVYVAAGNLFTGGKASIITGAGQGGGSHVEVFNFNSSLFNRTVFPAGGVTLVRSFIAYPETPFFGGVRVAAGDVNGDGIDDIITGAGPGGGPHVRVFDGRGDGSLSTLLQSFFAYAPTVTAGVFVGAGNYASHADGHVDIITAPGFGSAPHVRIFDGQTLGIIASFFAFTPVPADGVGSVGFVTGQGNSELDIIVGSGPDRPAVSRLIPGTGGEPATKANATPDNPMDLSLVPDPSFYLSGVGVFVGGFPIKRGG